MALADVASVGVKERTGTPYNGGLRRRVQLNMRDGKVHLLIVKHPDDVAQELRSRLARPPASW